MSTRTPIRLIDAVKFTKNEPHQLAAWHWLESALTPDQLTEFALLFRAAPAPKAGVGITNTWDGIITAARNAGAGFPELVAAQWALESGWGKKTSGSHNYFGLKGSGSSRETREFINGDWITITDSFLNFPDIATCIQYLVDRWYKDWKSYKGVNNEVLRDAAAKALVRESYGTDPSYADKLIALMNEQSPIARLTSPSAQGNPMRVPYYSQRDSNVPGQATRMCFSSSCAMLVNTLRPGSLQGLNADDQYLKRVHQFGDTTDAAAQLRALRSYGIQARFTQSATWSDIERQISRSVPVPCGFLHHGTSAKPTGGGGGHWLTVIGFTKTAVIVNDPFGELDVVHGGYVSSKGAGLAYSRGNWGPRWMVEGPGTGWAIIADP
jgi:hypothetical protein